MRWKEKDGEENRDKDENGEEGDAGCPVLEWINNAEHIDVDENEVEEEGRSKK